MLFGELIVEFISQHLLQGAQNSELEARRKIETEQTSQFRQFQGQINPSAAENKLDELQQSRQQQLLFVFNETLLRVHCPLVLLAAVDAAHLEGCNIIKQFVKAELGAEVREVLSEAALEDIKDFELAIRAYLALEQLPKELADELIKQLLFSDVVLDLQKNPDCIGVEEFVRDEHHQIGQQLEEVYALGFLLVFAVVAQKVDDYLKQLL